MAWGTGVAIRVAASQVHVGDFWKASLEPMTSELLLVGAEPKARNGFEASIGPWSFDRVRLLIPHAAVITFSEVTLAAASRS